MELPSIIKRDTFTSSEEGLLRGRYTGVITDALTPMGWWRRAAREDHKRAIAGESAVLLHGKALRNRKRVDHSTACPGCIEESESTEVRRIGEGSGDTVHTLFVPPIITPEQKAWIKHNRSEQRVASAFQAKVFSGDVYGRSSPGQVEACDPDGNIRQNETWPTRGVPLEEADVSARSA